MIKLQNLLKEEKSRTSFKTQQTAVNPETGKITWSVQYHPAREVEKGLDKLDKDLKSLLDKNPQDTKFEEYYETFRKYKKSLNTYLNKQYSKN
jgi:hypothetical protein